MGTDAGTRYAGCYLALWLVSLTACGDGDGNGNGGEPRDADEAMNQVTAGDAGCGSDSECADPAGCVADDCDDGTGSGGTMDGEPGTGSGSTDTGDGGSSGAGSGGGGSDAAGAGGGGSGGAGSGADAGDALDPYGACDFALGRENNPDCPFPDSICNGDECVPHCMVVGPSNAEGPGDDCPDPLSGNAGKACYFGLCSLLCAEGQTCPDGMVCQGSSCALEYTALLGCTAEEDNRGENCEELCESFNLQCAAGGCDGETSVTFEGRCDTPSGSSSGACTEPLQWPTAESTINCCCTNAR